MKYLIVLHLCGSNNLDKILKQHISLKAFFKKYEIECDTYIYSNDQNIKFNENLFKGNVYYQQFDYLSAKDISIEILKLEEIYLYNNIILADDDMSSSLAVILAVNLKYKCITNVKKIIKKRDEIIYTRFAYNNNLLVDYRIKEKCVLSLRAFKYDNFDDNEELLNYKVLQNSKKNNYILKQEILNKAEDFVQSDVLLAVGMGVNSKSEIEKIRSFAINNNYSFGVTRAVAMRGWGSLNEIIGVSGNIFSPKICITIGVSGAAAFYVGIENSEYIFSINIDEDAPIINLSNSNLIIDYKKVINIVLNFIKNR